MSRFWRLGGAVGVRGGHALKRSLVGLVALLLSTLVQLGCSTADVLGAHVLKGILKDDPTIVRATVKATADVNPDARDRPSPIKVRFYLLKNVKVLQNASYYDLKDQDRELLADDLLLYEEQVFKPGSVVQLELKLPPEETLEDAQVFLGIVAGYWRVDQAIWQLSREIEVHDTTEMEITLGQTGVTATVVD